MTVEPFDTGKDQTVRVFCTGGSAGEIFFLGAGVGTFESVGHDLGKEFAVEWGAGWKGGCRSFVGSNMSSRC